MSELIKVYFAHNKNEQSNDYGKMMVIAESSEAKFGRVLGAIPEEKATKDLLKALAKAVEYGQELQRARFHKLFPDIVNVETDENQKELENI